MPVMTKSTAGNETVVYEDVRMDLLPEIKSAILTRWQSGMPGSPGLNAFGWKSDDGMPWWPEPAFRQLFDVIRREFLGGRTITSGWAMVNRAGSSHQRHIHKTATWSGVYFVDPGEEPYAPLIVERPMGKLTVPPNPGRLVLFSGRTFHSVPRYEGNVPRITIAFDAK